MLSDGGSRAIVVRSSSVVEDAAVSSMAGVFTSLVDVRGWDAFVGAPRAVLASASAAGFLETSRREPAPMAVLVQLYLDARVGGVLFGVDPVAGRDDRLIVAAVNGGPVHSSAGACRAPSWPCPAAVACATLATAASA